MADHKADNYNDFQNEAESRDLAMKRMQSAGQLTISPELFEKLYLQPQTPVKGDIRKIVGNPTPLSVHSHSSTLLELMRDSGLVGFVVGLTPFACTLMGWRGTNIGPNTGAANM